MDQKTIIEILNRHVFNEDKAALIESITSNPDRFVGVFRSTTPRLKLLQNLLQSREIRFGDALEEVVTALLGEMGFINLPKALRTAEGEDLACDQYFVAPDQSLYYLVEQKVRDDHDSTKKRGQAANFRKKLLHLKMEHGASSLVGAMYFIDPSLHKNEGYYQEEIKALQSELGMRIHLFYNGEFFQYLQGHSHNWELILSSLQAWRETVPEHIALDYDKDPEQTLTELSSISVGIWHKLISNDSLWTGGVVQTLFPSGRTLYLVRDMLLQAGKKTYRVGRGSTSCERLADLLACRLDRFYR